jgi:hypothetical protein
MTVLNLQSVVSAVLSNSKSCFVHNFALLESEVYNFSENWLIATEGYNAKLGSSSICIQVLRAVKTKQVTHAILVHLTEYVKGLENAGLLESKETHQLHDAVQVFSSTIITANYIINIQESELKFWFAFCKLFL